MQSEQSAVILSRGGVWNPEPYEPPYLVAKAGQPFPSNAFATIEFTDTTGATLLELDGTVTPDAIRFTADAEDGLDAVPAGANFEISLETSQGVQKIRYGKVIRREATYFPPPAVNVTPLAFGDNFQRTALGRKWIGVSGRSRIFDNSLLSLPSGVTVDGVFFTKSAIRYYQQFTTDSIRMSVTVQNPLHLLSGKTSFVVCADANMSSGLAMQLETGITNNWIHMGMLNGPTSVTYEGSSVSNSANSGDTYVISYTDATKTLAVYKGTSLEPLATWVDDTGMVPHGPGYRYVGFIFEASLITAGIQVSSWSAKDDL
jgi:hypothetical protein